MPVEATPFIPPPTQLVVPEINLRPAREAKASDVIQLPELDQAKMAAVFLVVTLVPDLDVPALPLSKEVPLPPAAPTPAAALMGDPVITIKFEDAPAKSATNDQPAAPPPPVNTRPRRVTESVPVNTPAPNTRKRRVMPAPNKPQD